MSLARRFAALVSVALPLAVAPAAGAAPLTAGAFARAEVEHYAAQAHGGVHAPVVGVDYADCVDPAGDPAPGSAAWQQRDAVNQYCATLRLRDQIDSPAYGNANRSEGQNLWLAQAQEQAADGPGHIHGGFTTLIPGSQGADAFRALDRWTAPGACGSPAGCGKVTRITFTATDGAQLHGHVFEPVGTAPLGGWPGVVITDGSVQAYEQLYYWAAEDLVAHGYQVMTYDVQGQGDSDLFPAGCPSSSQPNPTSCQGVPYQQSYNFFQGAEDSLNWFDSAANPYFADLNTNEIAIAGHSLGASAVSEVGQCDTRVKTIVAWDDLAPVKTCNSAGETINPKYLATSVPRVPALAMTNDYEFNPESLNSPPNPHAGSINGGGLNGDTGYQQLAADNIDSMLVSLRNGTHLTYTYIPYVLPANELGERIASYYTVAWFDHYLKGDPTGLNRLTSTTFDDSADTDSIGAGLYDPTLAAQNPLDPTAGNVSYKIAGLKVSNIVSFYYMSEYRLHNGTTLLSCADMRQANCAVPASGTP